MKSERIITWIILTGLFAALCIAGFEDGASWYVATPARVLITLYFIGELGVLYMVTHGTFTAKLVTPAIPPWAEVIYDVSMLAFLGWSQTWFVIPYFGATCIQLLTWDYRVKPWHE